MPSLLTANSRTASMSLKSTGEVLKRADLARVPVDGLNVIHAAGETKLVRRKTT